MSPNFILKPILIAQIYEHTDGSYNKIQRTGVTWKSYIERIKIKPLKNRLTTLRGKKTPPNQLCQLDS